MRDNIAYVITQPEQHNSEVVFLSLRVTLGFLLPCSKPTMVLRSHCQQPLTSPKCNFAHYVFGAQPALLASFGTLLPP